MGDNSLPTAEPVTAALLSSLSVVAEEAVGGVVSGSTTLSLLLRSDVGRLIGLAEYLLSGDTSATDSDADRLCWLPATLVMSLSCIYI